MQHKTFSDTFILLIIIEITTTRVKLTAGISSKVLKGYHSIKLLSRYSVFH